MNKNQLLNEILAVLQIIKEDETKLQILHDFVMEEIYEEEEEKIEIPEKYKKPVHDIAESIDCGFVCFLNTDTLEHVDIPEGILEDLSGFDDDDLWQKDLDKIDDWENTLRIEPLKSYESFKIMERFVGQLIDEKLQDKLTDALENRRPFANFRYLVDDSDYRQDWFAHKQKCLEEYVIGQINNVRQ